jgi:hypothetical protein
MIKLEASKLWGPGLPAVGGGEWILRREEGVVGMTPSSLLK